jgi:hypothetical protein
MNKAMVTIIRQIFRDMAYEGSKPKLSAELKETLPQRR